MINCMGKIYADTYIIRRDDYKDGTPDIKDVGAIFDKLDQKVDK